MNKVGRSAERPASDANAPAMDSQGVEVKRVSVAIEQCLAGIRVLELGRLVAAPLAGQILGDLGADVVKVEHPGGDLYRKHGPSFVRGDDASDTSLSSGFISANRNKRSLIVDFSHPAGQALIIELAGQADILIENFKVGGLAKYGLDHRRLLEANPQLIYVSITGYGQDGPYAGRPATDSAIQAMSGLQSITGEPDRPPQKCGALVVDTMTGIYSALAAVAALRHRENGGSGQHIDMALLDCAIAAISPTISEFRLSDVPPRRQGNAHAGAVPAQTYSCSDGEIQVQATIETHFLRLCDCLGMPELAADARFGTRAARLTHESALNAILAVKFESQTVGAWMETLTLHGIICAPVNSVATALRDPQVVARELEVNIDLPSFESVPCIASPLRLTQTPVVYKRPPPRPGEHSDDVLRSWLGLEPSAIAKLRTAQVIC